MRAFVLAAVAAFVATASASAARTTAPGANGPIAFVRQGLSGADELGEIFVVNADATGERRLTTPPSGFHDDLPDWSPDGSRIVFQRCAIGGTCLLWAVRPDGTTPKLLSAPCAAGTCADERSAVYAPDARHIAFIRTAAAPALMVADASLRRARRVGEPSSAGAPYAVTWSPKGDRLAFASVASDGRRAVYVVNSDGTGVRRLTPWSLQAGGRLDWSPDGAGILFRSSSNRLGGFGSNLYTVRPDSTGLRRLTEFTASDRVLDASYAPDGTAIVVSTTAGASNATLGQPDIVVVRADGTQARPLTSSDEWDGSPDWGPRR